MKKNEIKMYQDKYLCFGIIFNHAKFLKDLTCRFLATPFSTIFLFNVLAHRYQKHRKNDLLEAKQIAHLNRSISMTEFADIPDYLSFVCGACSSSGSDCNCYSHCYASKRNAENTKKAGDFCL